MKDNKFSPHCPKCGHLLHYITEQAIVETREYSIEEYEGYHDECLPDKVSIRFYIKEDDDPIIDTNDGGYWSEYLQCMHCKYKKYVNE